MPRQNASARPDPRGRRPIQAYGEVGPASVALPRSVRSTSVENLQQLLADTLVLRDLYKKHHWQASGQTFGQLHLLFDRHAEGQSELADAIAERIQTLGGVAVAMPQDVSELTLIPRAPRDRESPRDQLGRLAQAHELILEAARAMAGAAAQSRDDGTNDLIVSEAIRMNEQQAWFISEHLRAWPA